MAYAFLVHFIFYIQYLNTMNLLNVFSDQDSTAPLQTCNDKQEISNILKLVGVRFEQWSANVLLSETADQAEIIQAYSDDINRLKQDHGYITVDAIALDASHPQKDELRKKFLDEHTHGEDEVRFFVKGQGLFSLRINNKVYEVLCGQGDLISVPANTPHWFDMGSQPNFMAIRLFNNPDGWVAHYTGDTIANQFTRLD